MKMSYEKVLRANQIVIGTKQTAKAIKNGIVRELIIAEDCDPRVTESVENLARQMDIPVLHVDSAKKLGKACKIEVKASAVAIIR